MPATSKESTVTCDHVIKLLELYGSIWLPTVFAKEADETSPYSKIKISYTFGLASPILIRTRSCWLSFGNTDQVTGIHQASSSD